MSALPVCVADIIRLESDDDYTAIHVDGRRLLAHVTLRDMERRLDPKEFLRVHRSSIVNLAHVRHSEQSDRRVILTMSDGSRIISSRSRAQLINALRFLSISPFAVDIARLAEILRSMQVRPIASDELIVSQSCAGDSRQNGRGH